MEEKRSIRLVLKTSDLWVNSTTAIGQCDQFRTTFTWFNINLRILMGDLYEQYDYFNLSLISVSSSLCNGGAGGGAPVAAGGGGRERHGGLSRPHRLSHFFSSAQHPGAEVLARPRLALSALCRQAPPPEAPPRLRSRRWTKRRNPTPGDWMAGKTVLKVRRA